MQRMHRVGIGTVITVLKDHWILLLIPPKLFLSMTQKVTKSSNTSRSQLRSTSQNLLLRFLSKTSNSLDHCLMMVLHTAKVGIHELKSMRLCLRTNWNVKLNPLSNSVRDWSRWKYGSRNYSDESRHMLGSAVITPCLNSRTSVSI